MERMITSFIDGFKPGQRKVLFACFKKGLASDMKVAQLSGYVAEQSSYHHGETSLQGTIVGLAQNFVGSNNVNLLMPQSVGLPERRGHVRRAPVIRPGHPPGACQRRLRDRSGLEHDNPQL